MELTEQERTTALAEYDAAMAEPAPRDRRPAGCLTALASIILLGLLPTVARAASLPRTPALIGAAVLAGAFLVGLALYVLGGGGAYGKSVTAAEQALEGLSAREPAADAPGRTRLAARLLAHAYVTSGPTTVTSFAFEEAVRRLGPHLEHVKAVERMLVGEREIYPVFTLDDDAGGVRD